MVTNEELNKALSSQNINGEARLVDLDDTIKFNCKRCGKCCSGRTDIILNPYDVYNIAKGLGITPEEVIKQYCNVHCGSNSCLPIVTLKEDKRGLCPFLKFFANEGKFGCSVNNFKPGACIMHPIGIVRSVDQTTHKQEKQFIEVPSCDIHGIETEIKIRDFIKPYLDKEEEHDIGSMLTFEVTKYIDTRKFIKCFVEQDDEMLHKYFSKEKIEVIKSLSEFLVQASYKTFIGSTLMSLYDFDMNKGFIEQIDDVNQNIKDSCIAMLATFSIIGFDFSSNELTEEDKSLIENRVNKLEEGFKNFTQGGQ